MGESSSSGAHALHPAIAGAANRGGRVTGSDAAATIVHLLDTGALRVARVEVDGTRFGRPATLSSVEFALVPAVSTHSHGNRAPFVSQGRVEGLTAFDRLLLSILFDRVSHAPRLSLVELQAFAMRSTWQYWGYLKEWRQAVAQELTAHEIDPGQLIALERRVDDALTATPRASELAYAVAFDRWRQAIGALQHSAQQSGAALLFRSLDGAKPAIHGLRKSLSPSYPWGYSPPSRIGFTPVPSRAKPMIIRADEE